MSASPASTVQILPPAASVVDVERPAVSGTLYVIEENLAAFLDTVDAVPAEQEAEFIAELGAAMFAAVDKRDRVGQFMAHLDAQISFGRAEIERITERIEAFERALGRMEGYVQKVIEALGTDQKGRYRRLEGKTVTFSLRACPASVNVTDEEAIPAAYKTAAVRMPAELFEEVLDALELELRARVTDHIGQPAIAVSKKAVKEAIDHGKDVPGADLIIGKRRLERK